MAPEELSGAAARPGPGALPGRRRGLAGQQPAAARPLTVTPDRLRRTVPRSGCGAPRRCTGDGAGVLPRRGHAGVNFRDEKTPPAVAGRGAGTRTTRREAWAAGAMEQSGAGGRSQSQESG